MLRTGTRLSAGFLSVCVLVSSAAAQQQAADSGSQLIQNGAVKAAVESARADEQRTIDDQIRICEVEAPPFEEAKRGELVAALFREVGLKNVRVDTVGNVIAERPGASER